MFAMRLLPTVLFNGGDRILCFLPQLSPSNAGFLHRTYMTGTEPMPDILFSLLHVISSLLVNCGNGIGWDSGMRPLYITSLLCTPFAMNIRVASIPDF